MDLDKGGLGWFQETITLAMPYIPENPDASWFNLDVVQKVQVNIQTNRFF